MNREGVLCEQGGGAVYRELVCEQGRGAVWTGRGCCGVLLLQCSCYIQALIPHSSGNHICCPVKESSQVIVL